MPHFLLYGPDKPDAQRFKHVSEHLQYLASLETKIIQVSGLLMPANNLEISKETGMPVQMTGTIFIYEADSFEEAQKIAHADPFWSSGEVWDLEKSTITALTVIHDTLPSKALDFKKLVVH